VSAAGQTLFVGVDGGATKTLLRVEDAQGAVLGRGQGGPANIRLSVEGSWRSIRDALSQALAQAGLGMDDGHRLYCGAGLAGTEVATACERFLGIAHPFARLVLRSDGYTSCLGAHGGADGAVIAVGTGTVGFQIEAGQECRVGGWGFPHGDEGGGAWLGLEAVRRTLHWLDGRAPPSPLLDAVHVRFDRDLDHFVSWANSAGATEFAQITPLVIEHVERQTPLALALIQEAAREIDRLGRALAARSKTALPCSLLGGLARFLEPWLEEALRARLVPCGHDAVQGAVLMIRAAVANHGVTSAGERM
jgi:glucosamine kinase